MLNRILIGVIGFIAAICIISSDVCVLSIALSIITFIAICEMHKTVGLFKKNNIVLSLMGIIYSLCLIGTSVYSVFTKTLGYESFAKVFLPATVFYMIATGIFAVLSFEKIDFETWVASFFTTLYTNLMFLHLLLIVMLPYGKIILWIVLLISWGTDTFAYFTGKFFGKHKLIEKVSAKKTVEGAIGGVVGAIFVLVIYALGCAYFKYTVNYVNMIIIAFFGSVISQFGDLIASCIKRHYNTKDYSNILLGHGGIMDRFDSVLVVAPYVYYICLILPIITK